MPVQSLTDFHHLVPIWVPLVAAATAWPAWQILAVRLVPAIMGRWENPGTYALAFVLGTVAFAPAGVLALTAFGVAADCVSAALAGPRGCRIERFLPDGRSAGVMFLCPGVSQPVSSAP